VTGGYVGGIVKVGEGEVGVNAGYVGGTVEVGEGATGVGVGKGGMVAGGGVLEAVAKIAVGGEVGDAIVGVIVGRRVGLIAEVGGTASTAVCVASLFARRLTSEKLASTAVPPSGALATSPANRVLARAETRTVPRRVHCIPFSDWKAAIVSPTRSRRNQNGTLPST